MLSDSALALAVAALVCAAAPQPVRAANDRGASRDDGGRPLPWFGVRLGGLFAASSASDGTPTAGGGGVYALFDGRDFLADVAFDAYAGDRARFFALGLGAYYPFALARSNTAPYLGGGLKLGKTRFGGDGAFGMIPFLSGGVLVGREGYVQLRAELTWFFTAATETRTDRPGETWHANGFMATLGLGF
jgi:hypothetical protein